MSPALRGIVADAIRHWWPTLRIYPETNKRNSPLIIEWHGREYRLYAEPKE